MVKFLKVRDYFCGAFNLNINMYAVSGVINIWEGVHGKMRAPADRLDLDGPRCLETSHFGRSSFLCNEYFAYLFRGDRQSLGSRIPFLLSFGKLHVNHSCLSRTTLTLLPIARRQQSNKVVVLLNGRYAGRKAVIVKNFDDGTSGRQYGHALVAGIATYPRKVRRARESPR
eukprot:8044229-Pyramimonas_sp.AAC.4